MLRKYVEGVFIDERSHTRYLVGKNPVYLRVALKILLILDVAISPLAIDFLDLGIQLHGGTNLSIKIPALQLKSRLIQEGVGIFHDQQFAGRFQTADDFG